MTKLWEMNDVLAAAAWYGQGTFAEDAEIVGVKPEDNLLVSAFDYENSANDRIRGIEVVESYRLKDFYLTYRSRREAEFYGNAYPGAGYRIFDVHTADAGLVRVGVVCRGGSESPKYIDRLGPPYDHRAGLFYIWRESKQRDDYPYWTSDVLSVLWHVENPDW